MAARDWVEAGGLMSYGTNIVRTNSPSRHLHRPHSQGRETRRPAGNASDQVRVRHQPANGADAGLAVPPTLLALADEVIEYRGAFAAVHGSVNGPKRRKTVSARMSAIGRIPDSLCSLGVLSVLRTIALSALWITLPRTPQALRARSLSSRAAMCECLGKRMGGTQRARHRHRGRNRWRGQSIVWHALARRYTL